MAGNFNRSPAIDAKKFNVIPTAYFGILHLPFCFCVVGVDGGV